MIRKVFLNKVLFIWLAFSSIIIALLFKILGTPFNLIILKDFGIIFILLIGLLFSLNRPLNPFLILIPIIFYILVSFIVSPANSFSKLASIRQMMMPFLLIFTGYLFAGNQKDYDSLESYFVLILKIILIFGFIEIITNAWSYIDIRTYYDIKSRYVTPEGYPIIFIEPFFDAKRMASTFLDPINLGHAFVFLFYILIERKESRIWILLSLVGILLTISKGAILQLIIIYWIVNRRQLVTNKLIVFLGIVFLMVIAYFFHGGLVKHVSGFYNSIIHLSIFGEGVAMTGNQAHMFSTEIVDTTGISDSFIGSLLGQFGIIGFLLWLLPLIYFLNFIKEKKNILYRLLISQFIVSALSENAFNLLAILPVCFLIGNMLYISYRKDDTDKYTLTTI